MRILYVTRDFSPHDERFLKALAGTDHEINLIRVQPSRNIPPMDRVIEIALANDEGLQPAHHRGKILSLKKAFKYIKPDVVHAGPIHGPAWLAARAGCAPLVSMSWGSDLLHAIKRNPSNWLTARYALKHSTVMVGDCQAVADQAVRMGFSRTEIFLFPWGVDLVHFSPT